MVTKKNNLTVYRKHDKIIVVSPFGGWSKPAVKLLLAEKEICGTKATFYYVLLAMSNSSILNLCHSYKFSKSYLLFCILSQLKFNNIY